MTDHHWMQTYNSGQFSYAPSGRRDINIIDIARSLSRIPRFLGHSSQFVSVAEHSVVTAQYLEDEGHPPRVQMVGLLHDAHEAYIGDLPRPLIHFLRENYGVDLGALKADIQRDIHKGLDLEPATPMETALIRRADDEQLAAERQLFMRSSHEWVIDKIVVPDYLLGAYGSWDQDAAMHYFEKAYNQISTNMKFDTAIKAAAE